MAGKKKNSPRDKAVSEVAPEIAAPLKAPTSAPDRKDALILLVYVLLTLAFSCIPMWPHVFPEGRTPRLVGPDPYFHLRHAEAVLRHYPVVERTDRLTNFPAGEVGLNQGLFDVAVATLSLVTPFSPLTILIWISPVCLILVGAGCYFWLSRATNRRCGLYFLLFYLLYPGALTSMASFGEGDHHAAELLQALAVMWCLYQLLRPQISWRWAPLAVLPLFCFYLSWAGTVLHLGIVGLIFFLRAWRPAQPEESTRDLALKGSLYGLTLLLAVLLVHVAVPWAVIWETSERVFLLGSGLLTLGYPLLVLIAQRAWKRPFLVAIATLAALFGLAMLVPTTRALIMPLIETRTHQIAEHAVLSSKQFLLWLGFLWLPALLGPLKIWYRGVVWPTLVPLAYGAALIFFWLQTRDFAYYAPPVLAAGAAYALEGLVLAWAMPLIGLFLVLPPFLPKSGVAPPWMTMPMIRETMMYTDGMDEASVWLKETQGDIQPDSPEAFGLVTPWDIGNIIAQTSGVPVGWSQTVSPELAQIFYTDQPDAAYHALTNNNRRLRYILLPARNLSDKFLGEMFAANLDLGSMYADGQILTIEGTTMKTIVPTARNRASLIVRLYWNRAASLGHFRVVYESPTQSMHTLRLTPENANLELYSFALTDKTAEIFKVLLRDSNQPTKTSRGWLIGAEQAPEVRVFEAVPGALLSGKAKPGTTVIASLNLHTPTTNDTWQSIYTGIADAKGTYRVRLPYPTDVPMSPAQGTVEVPGPYLVTVGQAKPVELKVSEADIQAGREISL